MTNPTPQGVTLREAIVALENMTDCDSVDEFDTHYGIVRTYLSHPPAPEQASGEPDLEKIIDSFVEDYQMNDGEAFHSPSEFERLLIKDAIMGLLVDEAWDNAWGEHIKSLATPTVEPDGKAVPKGWKLVPVEPTKQMLKAGTQARTEFRGMHHTKTEAVYKAMLSASPAAPEAAKPVELGDVVAWQNKINGAVQYKSEHMTPDIWASYNNGQWHALDDLGDIIPSARLIAAKPEQQAQAGEPTGCACRWDKDDNRVQTCERHQGWLDVVHEWAERAKSSEAELQSHREAMAAMRVARVALLNERDSLYMQATKKDAALKACVEALGQYTVPGLSGARIPIDTEVIDQAEGAMK